MKSQLLKLGMAVFAAVLFFSNTISAATVSWVGGSGDWTNTANWSTGILPGTNDNVVISPAATITVTHSAGTHTVNSIQSTKAFVLSGGLLAVTTTFQASNTFTLSGGTLQTATVTTTNGASLIVNGSGTLNGVTVNGTLDVGKSYNGANLTVTNGLVLNGTALVGNPTNGWYGQISFAGSQTLSGNGTVVFGNYGGFYNALWLVNGGTTLTIGSGILVRGQNGTIGDLAPFGGPANVAVINQGTISADVSGGTIYVVAQPFTNLGVVQSPAGGLSINLWQNSGQTIVVSTNTGSLRLSGGTIQGGTITVDRKSVV